MADMTIEPTNNAGGHCPLCMGHGQELFKQMYYICSNCCGIYMAPQLRLSAEREKARYQTHKNDVENPGYQKFVTPLVEMIGEKFSPQHRGLDFGAGPGPVLSKLLSDKGYNIRQYDPFFHYHPELLEQTYDYIACCEVIEHFYEPLKEFRLLHSLLGPGGRLICKTHLYSPEIDFSRWYYKNDETHVFIYQAQTLAWIKETVGFSAITISDRIIELCR